MRTEACESAAIDRRESAAAPTRHLVCYAGGALVHRSNRARLVDSALRFGIDDITAGGPESLPPSFRDRHRAILAETEGDGYWLWKPYLILDALRRAREGDVIIYVDSGAYLRRSPEALWQAAEGADLILFENDYPNSAYVKRDAFILTETDTSAYHATRQLDACFMIVRNRPPARAFVERWLDYCTDPRALTDQPNELGAPNLPGFVAHRHDQAVLSLLFWRERGRLAHVLHPRRLKHRYIVHHRRRTTAVPIWLWHLSHDAAGYWMEQLR